MWLLFKAQLFLLKGKSASNILKPKENLLIFLTLIDALDIHLRDNPIQNKYCIQSSWKL